MANINIKETVRRRIYMAKYSIITKTEKFFIGSLAACSYRIQYPVLDGAPTEINGFFERFAMALAGYAERRYAEMKASGRRLTADEAEIHSLLCEVFENECHTSTVFTYMRLRGSRCRKCIRFSAVWDNNSFLAASPQRLGISRRAMKGYDGFYIKNDALIGYRNPPDEAAYDAFPPSPARLKSLFYESDIGAKKSHITANDVAHV